MLSHTAKKNNSHVPVLGEKEQTGQVEASLEDRLPACKQKSLPENHHPTLAKGESALGWPIPLPREQCKQESLQPRASCFRDLREGEPGNSHPRSRPLVVWIGYSVPSGHRPPRSWRWGSWQDCAAVGFWLVHPNFPCREPECRVRGASRSRGSWDAMGSLPGMARGCAQGTVRVWGLCSAPRLFVSMQQPRNVLLQSPAAVAAREPWWDCFWAIFSHISVFQIPFLFLCYCLSSPFPPKKVTSEHLQNRMRGNHFSR